MRCSYASIRVAEFIPIWNYLDWQHIAEHHYDREMSDIRASVAAWRSLLTVTKTVSHVLDFALVEKHDLTLEDYDVLLHLAEAREPLRMTELAEKTLIARSSCTRVVDRLVARGLVTRAPSTSDRRSVTVTLTKEGRGEWGKAARDHARDIDAMLGSLPTADLAHLQRIAGRVQAAIEEHSE